MTLLWGQRGSEGRRKGAKGHRVWDEVGAGFCAIRDPGSGGDGGAEWDHGPPRRVLKSVTAPPSADAVRVVTAQGLSHKQQKMYGIWDEAAGADAGRVAFVEQWRRRHAERRAMVGGGLWGRVVWGRGVGGG